MLDSDRACAEASERTAPSVGLRFRTTGIPLSLAQRGAVLAELGLAASEVLPVSGNGEEEEVRGRVSLERYGQLRQSMLDAGFPSE